jgi:hypothetical protein
MTNGQNALTLGGRLKQITNEQRQAADRDPRIAGSVEHSVGNLPKEKRTAKRKPSKNARHRRVFDPGRPL